jgi:CheY-specific phosphatase CheX
MKTRIERRLLEASTKAFEDTCFMYVMDELEDIQTHLHVEAGAEVKYRGSFSGRLTIETSGGLYETIAINMLGRQDITPQQKQDALGEMANIICGNIIPALGSERGEYGIETPHALEIPASQSGALGDPVAKVTLNLNSGKADIKFYVNGYYPVKEKNGD